MSSAVKTGTFSQTVAGAGFPVSALAGQEPNGPVVEFIIYVAQIGVPEIAISLGVAPNTGGISGQASDSDPDEIMEGDPPIGTGVFQQTASVVLTYFPYDGNTDKWIDIHGFVVLVGGLITIAATSSYDHPIFVRLTYNYKDPNNLDDWFNPGPEPPQNIQHVESDELDEFDEPTGNKNQTFTWDLPAEELVGTIIQRDGETIAILGYNESDETITTFTDIVAPDEEYTYTFFFYYLGGDGISEAVIYPLEAGEEPPGVPDINIVSDMALALDWNSVMAFITDPSGIYGLIPNKTHDTLYNRDAEQTSINVKIPDPFVRLAFLPDE